MDTLLSLKSGRLRNGYIHHHRFRETAGFEQLVVVDEELAHGVQVGEEAAKKAGHLIASGLKAKWECLPLRGGVLGRSALQFARQASRTSPHLGVRSLAVPHLRVLLEPVESEEGIYAPGLQRQARQLQPECPVLVTLRYATRSASTRGRRGSDPVAAQPARLPGRARGALTLGRASSKP